MQQIVGIWPLQFREFFLGSGSCSQMLQMSGEIPSGILSVEAMRNRYWVLGLQMLEHRTKSPAHDILYGVIILYCFF
jgi:hypothetical protein